MKRLLILLSLFISFISVKAQYGDQDSIKISTPYGSVYGLLHLPHGYKSSSKYPFILFDPGVGETTIKSLVGQNNQYPPYFFNNNSWDGTAINPRNGHVDSFIVFSVAPTMYCNNPLLLEATMDNLRSNYAIDITSLNITGFSGGGQMTTWYPNHIKGAFPTSYFTPKYHFATSFPIAAESNGSDPMQNSVSDSVHFHGYGDPGETHGAATVSNINSINAIKSGYARLTTHSNGHTTTIKAGPPKLTAYNPGYKEKIGADSMNMYQEMLYYRKGSTSGGTGPPPSNSISLGIISPLTYCVTNSYGITINVPVSTIGTLISGNVYELQLSDKNGDFTNFVVLKDTITNSNNITIKGLIPASTPTGTNYLVRVKTNNPVITSNLSASIIINLASVSISPLNTQNIITGTNGTTLSGTEGSSASSRVWKYGTTIGIYPNSTGITSLSYSPNFLNAGTYYVALQSIFSCGTITSSPVQINVSGIVVPPTSHRIYITKSGSNCGFVWTTGNPGDTLVMSRAILGDTICYGTITVNGSPTQHIVLENEGGKIVNIGSLKLFNCHNLDLNFDKSNVTLPHAAGTINGVNYDIPYSYEGIGINGSGGPAFEIRGKDSNITVHNMYIHDKGKFGKSSGYGIIIKNDPNDFGCDTTYDYPLNTMSNITVYNIVEERIQQDGNYLGSSIGYNLSQMPQTCTFNGVQKIYHPRPSTLTNCYFYNFFGKEIARSFFQAGQLQGYTRFKNINVYNAGWSADITQGALIAVGNPDSTVEISNCTSNLTYKPAVYAYNYGKIWLHDNKFDSAGYMRDSMGIIRSQNVSVIELYPDSNTYHTPMQFVINDNKFGAHPNQAGYIGLYAGKTNNYSSVGNVICHNTDLQGNNIDSKVYHFGVNAPWLSNCDTGIIVNPYPKDTIVKTTHDSVYVYFIPDTIHKIDHLDTVIRTVSYSFNHQVYILEMDTTYNNPHFYDSIFVDTLKLWKPTTHDTTRKLIGPGVYGFNDDYLFPKVNYVGYLKHSPIDIDDKIYGLLKIK